jgi:hypothetical protein
VQPHVGNTPTQRPVAPGLAAPGFGPTVADAICDRLLHNARALVLRGQIWGDPKDSVHLQLNRGPKAAGTGLGGTGGM